MITTVDEREREHFRDHWNAAVVKSNARRRAELEESGSMSPQMMEAHLADHLAYLRHHLTDAQIDQAILTARRSLN